MRLPFSLTQAFATAVNVFLLSSTLASAAEVLPEPLAITHLSNSGFLLVGGGRQILIDGLVGDAPRYVALPDDVRSRLAAAEPPFDAIDLVLATHYHADHFDPQAVGQHLVANDKARFVSTPQAVEQLQRQFAGWQDIESRVRAVYPQERAREVLPELGLEVFHLHHGRDRRPLVENLGFLVDLGGWKIFHVGDTEATLVDFLILQLRRREIDVAMMPLWYLIDDRWSQVIAKGIRPRRTVVMHLAPNWHREAATPLQRQSQRAIQKIGRQMPTTVLFSLPMERKAFAQEQSGEQVVIKVGSLPRLNVPKAPARPLSPTDSNR